MTDVIDETGRLEQGFPIEDPAVSLPEPAQELLQAARRLLQNGGFDALRLDAIVAEAGKNKASVKYYFGNKDGLILALLDSLDHEQCLALAEQTRGAVGQERLHRYVDGQTGLAGDGDSFLMFFDVLPHVLRDERLRPRVARLYEWYRSMNLVWLGLTARVKPDNEADFLAFASLMVACVDGLAMQALLAPSQVDVGRSLKVLEFFLECGLANFVDGIDHEAELSAMAGEPGDGDGPLRAR